MFNKYYWLCLSNCFEIPKTRFSNCKIGNCLSLFEDRTDTLCLNFRLKLAISFLLYCLFMTENGWRAHFERRLWNSQKYRKVQVYDTGNHCCKRVVSLRQVKLVGELVSKEPPFVLEMELNCGWGGIKVLNIQWKLVSMSILFSFSWKKMFFWHLPSKRLKS